MCPSLLFLTPKFIIQYKKERESNDILNIRFSNSSWWKKRIWHIHVSTRDNTALFLQSGQLLSELIYSIVFLSDTKK